MQFHCLKYLLILQAQKEGEKTKGKKGKITQLTVLVFSHLFDMGTVCAHSNRIIPTGFFIYLM